MGPCQIIFLISPSSPKQTRKLQTIERSWHRTRCEHPCLFPIIHGLTHGVGKLCLQLTVARHITDKSTNIARGNGLAWKKRWQCIWSVLFFFFFFLDISWHEHSLASALQPFPQRTAICSPVLVMTLTFRSVLQTETPRNIGYRRPIIPSNCCLSLPSKNRVCRRGYIFISIQYAEHFVGRILMCCSE